MKKVLVIAYYLSFLSAVNLLAQNVGIGTSTPDASARLDVVDANRGVLIPRVALTNTTVAAPVTAPATSLLVYNTNTAGDVTPGFYYWNGTVWVRLLNTQSNDWMLDGNNNGVLRTIGTNDNFDFPIETNGTEKMRVTVGGNVGIGTAAPNARLEVSGVAGTATEPQLRIFNPNNAVNETAGLRMRTSGWDVKLQTVQGVDWFQFTNSVGAVQHSIWSNRFYPGASSASGVNTGYISGNGTFIGVGTVAPTQRLHVAGGSILGDQAYAASTLDLAAAAAINIAQPATQVRITNVAGVQANAVTYSATAIEGQYLWISNTDNDAATFAGATIPSNTAMGFVYTGGAWRPVRAMDSQGDWKLDGNTNGALRYIGTNDNFDFPIRTNGTEKMRVTTAGNVGIGNTAPNFALTVTRTAPNTETLLHLEGTGDINAAGINIRDIDTDRMWHIVNRSADNNKLQFYRWNAVWQHVMTMDMNGRVGIGTTTPGFMLDVADRMRVRQGGAGTAGIWFYQTTPAADRALVGMALDDLVGFWGNTGAGWGLVMNTTTGNVGIGTTNPLGNGADLHLGGDGEVALSFGTHSTAGNNSHFVLNDAGNVRGLRYYSGNYGSGTHIMTILNSGNVGIGTMTPPSKLTIANNIATDALDNFSEYQILLWQNAAAVNSYGLGIRGGTMVFNSDANYHFDEDGVTRVTFAGGGYVGIATSNPRTRLDVITKNGTLGNGTSQDGPTNAIIEAGFNSARQNDWNNGWGGGLSTWDIVGASTKFNNYVTRSDRAYKTNISPIEADPNFVQKFMQLNPVTYNFNRETIQADEPDYQRLHYGFIANEVEKLFPDIVANAGLDPSIKRGLEYDAFIPMLVKIVQNQQKTIENLQQENTSLKSEMQELKNELDHLKAYVGLKSQK